MPPSEELRRALDAYVEAFKDKPEVRPSPVENLDRTVTVMQVANFLIEAGLVAARVNQQTAPESTARKIFGVSKVIAEHLEQGFDRALTRVEQQQLQSPDPAEQAELERQKIDIQSRATSVQSMKSDMRHLLDLADEILGVFDDKKTRRFPATE